MKLDPRFLLPAALLAGALALPGAGSADPNDTGACPDHYMGPIFVGPFLGDKDKNGDQFVCVKEADGHLVFKDDNCNPNCDADDLIIPVDPNLPTDSIVDNILP
jgi:hypothetical protein